MKCWRVKVKGLRQIDNSREDRGYRSEVNTSNLKRIDPQSSNVK